MNLDLTDGIVRIVKPNGTTAGTGFVVTNYGLIATCAHVIEAAGVKPGGVVRLAFLATGEEREAVAVSAWWRASDAEDIAILRLQGNLPRSIHALPLGSPGRGKGHRFETFGFSSTNPNEGMWGSGEILGETAVQGVRMAQLSSGQVTTGFSGAPVWDRETWQVIGMVSTITRRDDFGRQAETVFAVSTEVLAQVCPQLQSMLPPFAASEEAAAPPPELRAGEQVELEGKAYLVREVVAQRAFEALVVRAARASDCKMGRDVGLRQVATIADSVEARASLHRVVRQGQRLGQAASGCPHLPQVYGVVEEEPGMVCVIVEWIQGTPIDNLMAQDGPLPGPPSLRQLMYWAADVCDALTALHRRRISHGGVSGPTILITPSQRGPVLIDPGFASASGTLLVELSAFDPAGDVYDLAAALYRVITHHPPQAVLASDLNPFAPRDLGEALRDALAGSIRRADQFKRRLREVQATLRTA